jgi:hypothetical protein
MEVEVELSVESESPYRQRWRWELARASAILAEKHGSRAVWESINRN